MGSGQITKNLITVDPIKIIQFCLKIYDLSVGQWVGSGHITKYQINLGLIEIIQFCLKIYDLLRHPILWVGVWVNGWGQVK